MRSLAWSIVLVLSSAAVIGAEQTTPPSTQAEPPQKSTKLVTLVGCVSSDNTTPGQYTISDKDGAIYRLTGTDVRKYVGQQVEVTGGSPKKFVVAGGLLPSPNAAAQAGAIDPPPAAAAGPTNRGAVPLAEFRVKSVKTVAAACQK